MSEPTPVTRRRFGRLLGACSAALVCPPLRGQVAPEGTGPTPMTPAITTEQLERLKVRAGRIIGILQQHVETGYLAGAVALIGDGNRAEVVTVGVQSLEGA